MAAAYDPPVADEQGDLVIRPSWRAVPWIRKLVTAPIAAGLLVVCIVLLGLTEKSILLALFLGLAGLILAVSVTPRVVFIVSSRIIVTDDAIVLRHWFGLRARVKSGDIARVVQCSVKNRGAPLQPAVFALAKTGLCVMSLFGDRWSQVDMDRIWRHLGIRPQGSYADIVSDQDLDKTFPGAF